MLGLYVTKDLIFTGQCYRESLSAGDEHLTHSDGYYTGLAGRSTKYSED